MRIVSRAHALVLHRAVVAAVAILAWLLSGCSGSGAVTDAGDEDAGGGDGAIDLPDSPGEEATSETHAADADGDDATEHDEWDLPPLPHVVACGDGVLDEGEECDDRNRLNGDGCDWLCRLGDGDPSPDPDPSVDDYEMTGDPVIVVDDAFAVMPESDQLPLVWTGTEFATVLYEVLDTGDRTPRVRFFRFDREGRHLDAPWTYESTSHWRAGLDLVWIEDGFGLFYAVDDAGIYYQRLDATGKPVGAAVLVEPDPDARFPSADRTADGFVLAWWASGSGAIGSISEVPTTTRVRLVGLDGSTSGPPVVVDEFSGGPPDIATGPDGFGVRVFINQSLELPACSTAFVHLSADLSAWTPSGVLSWGPGGDVKWNDGEFVVGWPGVRDSFVGSYGLCVARFSPDGTLLAPPVCNDLSAATGGPGDWWGPRIAAGDGGLALVGEEGPLRLFFLRTDLEGTAVGAPTRVLAGDDPERTWPHAFNTVWARDGFAVLFAASRLSGSGTSGLCLRWFHAATP